MSAIHPPIHSALRRTSIRFWEPRLSAQWTPTHKGNANNKANIHWSEENRVRGSPPPHPSLFTHTHTPYPQTRAIASNPSRTKRRKATELILTTYYISVRQPHCDTLIVEDATSRGYRYCGMPRPHACIFCPLYNWGCSGSYCDGARRRRFYAWHASSTTRTSIHLIYYFKPRRHHCHYIMRN